MSIDHIGERIVRGGTGSKLEIMKLHRTKCASLIKNVVSPALHEDLCKDMTGGKFCVMIDESKDVACLKYLCVAVRFYSKVEKKIVTAFVGLIPVVRATGKDLFIAMKAFVEAAGLKMCDCVGFSSNRASVMVGEDPHDGIPQEAVAFWSGVHQYQNSVQEFPFTDLAAYALTCLTTPTSNAVVERIFSFVTNVKTKNRN